MRRQRRGPGSVVRYVYFDLAVAGAQHAAPKSPNRPRRERHIVGAESRNYLVLVLLEGFVKRLLHGLARDPRELARGPAAPARESFVGRYSRPHGLAQPATGFDACRAVAWSAHDPNARLDRILDHSKIPIASLAHGSEFDGKARNLAGA